MSNSLCIAAVLRFQKKIVDLHLSYFIFHKYQMYATRIANPCEMYFSCICPKCINTTLPIMPFRPKWQGVEKIMCYDKLNKLCKSVQIYASFDYVYCTNHHELVVSKQEYWPHYTEGFVVNKDGHCQLTIKDFVVRCYDSSQCSSTFN